MIREFGRRIPIAVAIVLACTLTACSKSDLRTAARTIEGVADTNGQVIAAVIDAQKQGVIAESDARLILNGVCDKVAKAVEITGTATLQYTKFPSDARPKIAPLLQPILDAIQSALDTGVTGIKNEQTKAKVRSMLLTIQVAIHSAQAALGSA